ncbi:T9SS type A sorting domain-containing protein [Chryseobacterium sp. Ch-15]|uniref:T9SS type A sorting domain-containing protein n=1 Tax=Chryseobacterium muglaense TaxID=2893752 RepID=A0A9Q3YS82_9FLAO|nr:T9SS type A sorting domain-containing protein [Chryseobacterium muglaense]MBD3905978.1 T9SS type A sorting domain-containing protein [Chryseobacterium muglaense]MCC9035063.1 T9SS type A sorting domain-containing protein [Chryseobacterium muglaense]MCM2555776.1 T9SS type A sorting domain-containing protein [Chryseobacterium muglaense]
MFKNLYTLVTKVSLSAFVLSIAGSNFINAQQWQNVGNSPILSANGSGFNDLVIDNTGNYYVSYYDLSVNKGSVQKLNGTSWSYLGGSAGVTDDYANHNSLSVAPDGSVYHLSKGNNMDVNKFSGAAWSSLTSIPTSGFAGYPSSVVSSDNILYTYVQGTVRRFVNGAWQQIGTNVISGVTYHGKIKLGSNGKVYVCQIANGVVSVYENTLTASSTTAWTLVGGASLGNAFTESVYATLDFTMGADNSLYVVYGKTLNNPNDPNSLLRKINVKKFDGTSWLALGDENFGVSESNLDFSITVTPQGKPFVAASSWYENEGKNTVYEINSTTNTWSPLGGNYVSDASTHYNDLEFDTNTNSLVLAYSLDDYFSQGITEGTVVKKFALQVQPSCNNTDPGTNPGDLGCVTFNYRGQSVTYTTVRGTDGKIWLQQNLGSTKVASSLTDSDAYGDLFQWGRWDDGHQLRNSSFSATAPSPNNPSGLNGGTAAFHSAAYNSSSNFWSGGTASDTWTAENASAATATKGADPCKAIGLDWRLPTVGEIDAAMVAENISEFNSALSSHLKLIPAGMKDYSGIFSPGTRLYLWSSSASPYTGSGQHLYISGFSTLSNSASRDAGMSVRCIKDVTAGLGTTEIKKINIGVYPNPTNGLLNIKTDSEINSVNVTNVVGQRLKIQYSNHQINMQGLPSGVYIVEMILKNGQKISKKVIKN